VNHFVLFSGRGYCAGSVEQQAACRTSGRSAPENRREREWLIGCILSAEEDAMPEPAEDPQIAEFVRTHHVHFDVKPESAVRGAERVNVGFEVKLWAMHARGARVLPGCPKCSDLAGELRRVAEWAIPNEHRPTRVVIEPFQRALYDSKEVAGADEIAMSIRLIHREGYELPIDACEERCLKEIRERLRALKAQER
jgi:hypothetical protein